MAKQYEIYTDDYYGDNVINYGKGEFTVYPDNMSSRMRNYIRKVIANHNWDIDWYTTSSGEHYYGWDPIEKTTYTSVDQWSLKTLEAKRQLSWILLKEPYVGTPIEQGLYALFSWWGALTNVFEIKHSVQWIFSEGLFTKPYWVKAKDQRIQRRKTRDSIPF